MNGAHLHLVINHIPVIGIPIVTLLLAIAYFRHSQELIRVSLWLLVLMIAAGAATYLSGEGAEEVVKQLPDFAEELVERHELLGTITVSAAALVGLLTVIALVKTKHAPMPRWMVGGLLVGAIAGSVLVSLTGMTGGRIRHPEVRPGFTLPPTDLQRTPQRN
jgi:uncharacterized membrane protein